MSDIRNFLKMVNSAIKCSGISIKNWEYAIYEKKILKLKQLGYHSLAYPEYSYIDDLRIITNEVR